MRRALASPALEDLPRDQAVTVIAAGKAALPMAETFREEWPRPVSGLVASSSAPAPDPDGWEWQPAGHPVPDAGSLTAGRRALALAAGTAPPRTLVVLLSGGASAALAVPADGVSLETKVEATAALLAGGVAIDGLNCVRKHLSAIKGGWLAASAGAPVLTLAISDVVGPVADDPAVIGSGPTAADPTSFKDALRVVAALPGRYPFPAEARGVLEEGARRRRPETPKPGDARLAGSRFEVIGSRRAAMAGAARRAAELGYHVVTRQDAVVGEARRVGAALVERAASEATRLPRPTCFISSGETTVVVRGTGRGGRNLELALAGAELLGRAFPRAALASVGTDGVDGPTDAAGAIVDSTSLSRSRAAGCLSPGEHLDRNDSYAFFDALDDLVRLGPTETNVGDLQVMLIG